ncbi:MAG TPA: addiction module protein [Planctomycetaceae bacterium]
MPDRDAIAREALALPPEDRAYVADVLERSLDPGPFATPEIAEAWSKEIDRRIAAYDRGETRAIDMETALDQIREALAKRREAGGA